MDYYYCNICDKTINHKSKIKHEKRQKDINL